MTKSALPFHEVPRLLSAVMGVEDCVCTADRGRMLTVQFTYKSEQFTVAAVNRSEIQDEEAVSALGACLLAEADLMMSMNGPDVLFQGSPVAPRSQIEIPLYSLSGA